MGSIDDARRTMQEERAAILQHDLPPPIDQDFPLASEAERPNFIPVIEDIKIAREYIDTLKNASIHSDLSHCCLGEETIDQIQNPPTSPLLVEDPTIRLSLDLYLATGNASQDTYNQACHAIHC